MVCMSDRIYIAQGWTPLLSAASAGHDSIVDALISAGAKPQATNSSGRTALHYAVRCTAALRCIAPCCPNAKRHSLVYVCCIKSQQ